MMKVVAALVLAFLGCTLARSVKSDRNNCDRCEPPCCCKCVEKVIPGTGTTTQAPTTPGKCDKMLDLSFIIDHSGSIPPEDLEITKTFMSNFVSAFDIGLDKVRVSLIENSTDVSAKWPLDGVENTDINTLTAAINKVNHTLGWTDTVSAMEAAVNTVFVAPGDRPDVPNAAVVITDGGSDGRRARGKFRAVARSLQDVSWVAAVGVGATISNIELEIIATDGNIFPLHNFDELSGILQPLAQEMCDGLPTASPRMKKPDIIQRRCVCCCPRYGYGGYNGHDVKCC